MVSVSFIKGTDFGYQELTLSGLLLIMNHSAARIPVFAAELWLALPLLLALQTLVEEPPLGVESHQLARAPRGTNILCRQKPIYYH